MNPYYFPGQQDVFSPESSPTRNMNQEQFNMNQQQAFLMQQQINSGGSPELLQQQFAANQQMLSMQQQYHQQQQLLGRTMIQHQTCLPIPEPPTDNMKRTIEAVSFKIKKQISYKRGTIDFGIEY